MREVFNHLTDTERIFAYRGLWIGRGLTESLPSLDQRLLSEGAEADRISWAEHLAEFRIVRLATMSLLEKMPQSAWTRVGVVSGNGVSVRAIAFIIAGHTRHHFEMLNSLYMSKASLNQPSCQ
jgi:DinB superfamily